MATGVDQPGGPGVGEVTIEDDSFSTNGLYYTMAEINAYLVGIGSPDYPALGTFPESYRGNQILSIGDGVGTAVTTLRGLNETIIFDPGQVVYVNSVGAVNKVLWLGDKIVGPNGKPAGKNGCRFLLENSVVGGFFSWKGTVKIYGSHIRCSGTLAIQPGTAGLLGEIVDTHIDCGGGVSLGLETTGRISLIYNVSITLYQAGALLSNVAADYCEGLTVTGDVPILFNSNQRVRARRVTFGGSPTTSDIRISSATNGWVLNDVIWSDNCPQITSTLANTAFVEIWSPYSPFIFNPYTLAPIANMPVRVLRADGTEVVPTSYTDANGLITFGAADLITKDSVRVRRWKRTASVNAFTEDGPFTARFNMDGVPLPDYLPMQKRFNWPRRTSAFGDTLIPVYDGVAMVPFGALGREEWRPNFA